MNAQITGLARQAFPWLWLATFLFLAFTRATVKPPHPAVFPTLVATGFIHVLLARRAEMAALWRGYRGLWTALLVLIAAMTVAEGVAHANGVAGLAPWLPVQVWLVLCLPLLAVFLRNENRMRATIVVFCLLTLWHFVAMPVEAVTGKKLTWHYVHLLPRVAGPLNFQASGLAWQAYYFAGLFLPLFYLAWGPLAAGRIDARWKLPQGAWAAMCWLWLIPVVCVQSRAAFAGALAAALLALAAAWRPKMASALLGLGLLAGLGALAYWYLFSENKSGVGLRWAYFKLYIAASAQWPALLTGHGFSLVPDLPMFAQGLQPLQHSHNDLSQIAYSWGWVALAAYLAFWVALVRLVWERYLSRGEVWPACALLALLPSLFTDLGFQHFEKATFVMLLTAMCMAFNGAASRVAGAVLRRGFDAAAGRRRPTGEPTRAQQPADAMEGQ